MFPPGLARLVTWPVPTGSAWAMKTMGMEDVAAFRAPCEERPIRSDQIRLEPDQVGRKFGELSGVGLDPPVLDTNVHAFVPAAIPQTRPERLPPMRLARVRGFVPQDADAVNPFRRLRQDGERRRQCPDGKPAQERAPVHHWITSAARTRSDCGIVSPSALA